VSYERPYPLSEAWICHGSKMDIGAAIKQGADAAGKEGFQHVQERLTNLFEDIRDTDPGHPVILILK